MSGFRRDLPQPITIEAWAAALRSSPLVRSVEAMVDEHGVSKKSAGGNHYAPHELKVYCKDGGSRYLTTGVTMFNGPFHAYMRTPPEKLQRCARSVFDAAVQNILGPPAQPALQPPPPPPPAPRRLPAELPPPPALEQWAHYWCEEGIWHQHRSGLVVYSWRPVDQLPAHLCVYEYNGRRWVEDTACREWFWLDRESESEWF